MAKEREKQLLWVGPIHPVTGEPSEWLNGIDARDLDEDYLNQLTDEQYKAALDSGYYQKPKAKADVPSAEKGKEG